MFDYLYNLYNQLFKYKLLDQKILYETLRVNLSLFSRKGLDLLYIFIYIYMYVYYI